MLDSIKNYILQLDEKTFYVYLGSLLTAIVFMVSFGIYMHFNAIEDIKEELIQLNDQREEATQLFEKLKEVKQQEKTVDTIIKNDPDFKLGGYLNTLITKLSLQDKITERSSSSIDREGKYRESILNIRFSSMNIKLITELLSEIENNQRVYVKSLDIIRSKNPMLLDGTLIIGTLQLKTITGS